MTNTDSPWLAVTPGEWYASETTQMISTDLRQISGFARIIGAMCDYKTAEVFPQLDSPRLTVAQLNWMTLLSAARVFRQTSFPPGVIVST